MIFLIILVITAAILAMLFLKHKNKNLNTLHGEEMPYKRKKLLSEAESNFYQVLRTVVPPDRQITCKTRLEDLLYVENNSQKQIFRNRIKSKHVDFTVFNPVNGYTDFAIELDDKSHTTKKQIEADIFKNEVFRKIGMPLIRIPAKRQYDPSEIIEMIRKQSAAPDSGK